MAKENREIISLECTECKRINYQTTKRVKAKSGEQITRLEIIKYCKYCKKRTNHKETK